MQALRIFALLVVFSASASAQTASYEPALLRLSEIMGALHHLRPLCGGREAGSWREKMAAIVEAETLDPTRKQRLAGAFNRGYRTFEQTYRRCTPSAEAVIAAYLEEGRNLSAELVARYAN